MRYLLLFVLFPFTLQAQTIVKNEYDDFTNHHIIETSWEVLNRDFGDRVNSFFRFSVVETKEDTAVFLEFKMMAAPREVFAIRKGDELMIKLTDGSMITLNAPEYTITCTGCGARGYGGSGAQGLQIHYLLSKDDLFKLKAGLISKYRVYTQEGYMEATVNNKHAEMVKKAASLL